MMMSIGDTVFFKKSYVKSLGKIAWDHNAREAYRSPETALILVKIDAEYSDSDICHVMWPSNPEWGVSHGVVWQGEIVKTWRVYIRNLERRDFNTISLYELNRGL